MTFVIHVDQSFVREEIAFSVVDVSGSENPWSGLPLADARPRRWEALLDTLRHTERPTIVYTMSKPEADRLAAEIPPEFGTRLAYHAGLDDQRRRFVETEFLDGRCDIIIATNAFGMGVDKADVHSVIHWSVPSSPEALYQEAGRAARGSGERARAVLLFHPDDLRQAYRLLRRDVPNHQEIKRLDTALGEIAAHQQRNVVVLADADLTRLAALRQNISVHVALAHLERAGLIRELGRHVDTRSVSLGDVQHHDLTELEAALIRHVEETGPSAMLSAHELVGTAETDDPRAITEAIDGLVRRGALRYDRSVSIRMLTDTGITVIEEFHRAVNRVLAALDKHRRDHGATRYCRTLHQNSGDISLVQAAVELLATFGSVEVSRSEAAPDVLAVRLRPNSSPQTLTDAFTDAPSLIEAVQTMDQQRPMEVSVLCAATGLDHSRVISGLTLLHIAGTASVDLRSWQADPASRRPGGNAVGVVRTIEVLNVNDRESALEQVRQSAADRARTDRLRLEALRRYAQIAPSADVDTEVTEDAYQRYLERYLTEPDFLENMAADATADLLTGLTASQRKVVEHSAEPVMAVIAGPGTGKTRTIVTRIAYRTRTGLVVPERVLAVAFARVAAAEMTARLAQFGVSGATVRTLDSLAMRIVRENWATLGYVTMPTMVPNARDVIRSLDSRVNPRAVLEEIGLRKARREPLTDELHLRYQSVLAERNMIDFGDLKSLACRLLERDDRTAAPYLDAFDEVYVDEFQDLSPLQIHLATLISKRSSLTVVGDPRQSIFEWNGASPQSLLKLRRTASVSFSLTDNFRSTVQILDFAHEVIQRVLPDLKKVTSPKKRKGPPVVRNGFADAGAMFDHVAATVQRWLNESIPDNEIAVLAPTNELVAAAASRLARARIPTRTPGLVRVSETFAFEIARRHVDLIPAEVPTNSEDGGTADAENGGGIMSPRAVEMDTESEVRDDAADIVTALDLLRSMSVVAVALAGTTDREGQMNHSDWERLRSRLVDERSKGVTTLAAAFRAIERDRDDGPESAAGITVCTMTSSKGLEWDAVVVTGLGSREMHDSRISDEKCRLSYVALTRARHHLDLSWTGRPTTWLPA